MWMLIGYIRMDLRQGAMNVRIFVILAAVSFFQAIAGLEESDVRSSDEKLNRSRRQEEDTFNNTGMWISIGVFLAFDGLIVAFGIYKSYFGEIHMPVRREDRAPKVQNGKATASKEGEAEVTAVNPTFIDDDGNNAATQTDFPDETDKVEGKDEDKVKGDVSSTEHGFVVDCTTETPVIYTV